MRGSSEGTLPLGGRRRPSLASIKGVVAGHNIREFDLPVLEGAGHRLGASLVIDTLVLSLLCDPLRTTHALDKSSTPAGAVADPVSDARQSRERLRECLPALLGMDPNVLAFEAALLAAGGEPGLAWILEGEDPAARSLDQLVTALPSEWLGRFCRVRLGVLLGTLAAERPREYVSLALALRFIECAQPTGGARRGCLGAPPSPALASWPRFGELLTRLMGPLCPDVHCEHRLDCDVHRPFARDILQATFELDDFRPGQEAIVQAVLADATPLAILPTGGGKSLCYQLPAVHGAQRLRGLTVVVSPLQALIADQVRSLSDRYPGTCVINSQLLQAVRRQHLQGLRTGTYDIVYLGPEQLRNPSVVRLLSRRPPFLWVVDEAHCISQWGHGFRTDYTYLPRAIGRIHANGHRPLLSLFTATATREVIEDIGAQVERGLGIVPQVFDQSAPRENLRYEVVRVSDDAHKERELLSLLAAHPEGARLVYAATVRGVRDLGERLRQQGIACAHYHGQLAPNEKRDQLERFLSGRVDTVVATSAFGMGIDKPDIRLVVHHDLPGSVEDYVQETGRAGRDGQPAHCVLLFSEADLETQFFLKLSSLVTERDVRVVFRALCHRARRLRRDADGWVEMWVSPEDLFVEEELEEALDWSREGLHGKVKLVLYHLEADGAVERLENRTRTFAVDPLKPGLDAALAALPEARSPATERVLRYLYDPERPRELSILDVADEAGLTPAEAFRELHKLADLGIIGQELRFDVTFARQVPGDTAGRARFLFAVLDRLLSMNEDLETAPVVGLRAAAAELGREGLRCPPHELLAALRSLGKLGWLRLAKAGPGRFRVAADDGIEALRSRVADLGRTALALVGWADERLTGRTGRDLRLELDVARFVDDQRTLFSDLAFERHGRDRVVEAALLLHHFEAWHLSDPPVLFDVALKIRLDPRRTIDSLDLGRPRRQRQHEILLVHLLREYAVRPPEERAAYVGDYFRVSRDDLVSKWLPGRKRALERPVTRATEQAVLEGLTPSQRDAVTAEDEALLVVAGPGSGKTHTIVRRVSYMIRARQVRGQEILVLAFSRSAARELRQRLLDEVGRRARGARVRTFHALALELTGESVREDDQDPETRLAGVIGRAAELLETSDGGDDGHHRETVLGAIRHVLVDEYQDLDADQYRLLAALVGLVRGELPRGRSRTERSVVVVGDDDQAIFGFRQASVEFLRRFEQEFSARRVCLVECFRSRPEIVEAASRFAAELPGRLKTEPHEQLRPVRGQAADSSRADAVRRFRYSSPGQLAGHVAWVVQKSLEAGVGSIGILARHWNALDPVRGALESASIPHCLSHRDFHRALHRRHPAERVIHNLWKSRASIEGSARGHLLGLLEAMGRGPGDTVSDELLALGAEIDDERRPSGAGPGGAAEDETLLPISSSELADQLLLGSREADRRTSNAAPVWLGTFHGAKGLEFDKVLVLPARPDRRSDFAEEQRAFYVAMTRARDELVLASFGDSSELGARVTAQPVDVRRFQARLGARSTAYLDLTPRDVVLGSVDLGRAQARIASLREGESLSVVDQEDRVVLLAAAAMRPDSASSLADPGGDRDAVFVGELSALGVKRFRELRRRAAGLLSARVHEVFVQLRRDAEGRVTKKTLVVLPTFIAQSSGAAPLASGGRRGAGELVSCGE
ncbi:MAG: RecQ family ATP-dependent DNA helicase [Polyangiaceae bacterium]|nr:RecQ family ATP-dependent DNA helicase [Polyangiaceae bacterium]